jgi:hypothetical protein
MLGMHLASGDGAGVAGTKGLRFARASECDLTSDHHYTGIPIVRVLGVDLARFQAAVENLIAVAAQLGFEVALVHDDTSLAGWFVILSPETRTVAFRLMQSGWRGSETLTGSG